MNIIIEAANSAEISTTFRSNLRHTERVYTELSNHDLSRPASQSQNRKAQLLALLPDEFNTSAVHEAAAKLNIPRRTAERYLTEWRQTGLLNKIAFGQYAKTTNYLNTNDHEHI